MNKKVIILSVLIILLGVGGIFVCNKLSNKKSLNEIDISVDIDNGDEDIDWDNLDNHNIKLEKSITIDSEGIYNLTGNINDGSLIVDTDGYVKLVLNNVNINNKSGPAIIIEKAKSVVIELSEGSINKLSDGSNYDNEDYSGCIFSRSDLIFNGNGTLNLVSHYLDGIVSVDDLKFISGKYVIDSNDDGIRGKDSVNIIDGEFKIKSKNDGIKSNNEIDKNKGFVNIVNGNFDITSEGDGIQAFNKLIIYAGEFLINSGNGDILGKSIKSDDNIFIDNGKFLLVSNDDSIHTNKNILINNGDIKISSGDDGIHADNNVIINDGKIEINESYEGIEAKEVAINNGDVSVISSDDGINISGGNDSSSIGNRPDEKKMSSGNGSLEINSGIIYINANGDGIDVNGSIVINDGSVYIDGPLDDGNSAIDYDNSFDINGGKLIAVGSSGMIQGLSDSSKQYSITFSLDNVNEGEINLLDSDGNVLINYIPVKEYQSIIISLNDIRKNNTYTLEIDGKEITDVKVDSISTISGHIHGMGNGKGNKPSKGPGRK